MRRNYLTLTFLLLQLIFLINHVVQCVDEEDVLLQGINSYRVALNLTSLTKNDNAECFAEEIADQFKNQPCTNTTGSNTVPGTEPQFSNYPNLLTKCHLNISNTRDGAILPACVPNLEASQVLTNFTQSQYTSYLNDTKYVGAGISSENNWIVVVLTTNTAGGSFVTSKDTSLGYKVGPVHWMFLVLVSLLLL